MKKKILSILLAVVLVLCATVPVTAMAEEANVPQPFYSITAQDPEWAEFETTAAMRAAVHLDESVFDDLPTAEVLRAVLEYPLLGDIYLFNSLQEGIDRTMKHCTALRVFVTRPDAYATLRNAIDRNDQKRLRANLSDIEKRMTPRFLEALTTHEGFAVEAIEYKTRQNELMGTATVYTPKGSAVSVITRAEMSAAEIAGSNQYYKSKYPKATYVSTATAKYNCHSYAWYSSSTSNPYWMNSPSKYMSDGSYTRVQKISQASKVYYPDDNHSARVYDAEGNSINNATVISKWGSGPVMIHKVHYGPYPGTATLWA